MKFYRIDYINCGDISTVEYYRDKENAYARAFELNAPLSEEETQDTFYGVSECEFEDDPNECAQ